MNESFTPSCYTFRKNDDHVLFYKLEENKMSILEVTDLWELTQNYMSNVFSKGCLSHYLNGFAKRLSFVSQKYVKKCSCLFTVRNCISLYLKKYTNIDFLKKIISSANIEHYYLDIHQYSLTKCYWKTFLYHLCLY